MSPHRPAARAISGLLLSLLAIAAHAAEEDKKTPTPQEPPKAQPAAKDKDQVKDNPPKVEVKGSLEAYDARRHDTATKIVVTQEEILKYGDLTMGDVLKRLPGVTTGGGIRMRGLGAGYTQFLVNGEPPPPGFSIDSLTPDMIERIEIMRAATAEYSTQAIAGTINIVLKKMVVKAQRDVRIGLSRDNGQPSLNAFFQLADKDGPFAYAIGGGIYGGKYKNLTHTTEWADDAAGHALIRRTGVQEPVGYYRGINIAPRLTWTISPEDTLISQTYINLNSNTGDYEGRTNVEFGVAPPFVHGLYASTSKNIGGGTNLNWLRKLEQGAKLDAKLGMNFFHSQSGGQGHSYDVFDRLALISDSDTDATDKSMTLAGKYSRPLFDGHAFVTGWDGGISRRNEQRVRTETSATGLAPDNQNDGFTADVKRLALFVQDEWNVTPKWSVYFGLRWEGIRTAASASGQAEITNQSSVLSPLFQTLWRLPDSKADQVRLALTRTYKAPPTALLVPRHFASRENSFTSPDYAGNPNLKPELAWGLDLSFEHFIEGGGTTSVSAFMRRIEDIQRQQVVLLGDRWTSMQGNAGEATTQGIEMDAKVPLRSLVKGAPNIDLRGNLTATWSHLSMVPGPDNRLDSQIPLSGNIGADYKMDGGGPLSVGGNFSYQGGGHVRTSVTQYAWATPRRALDGYVAWKFDPKNTLRVSFGNLLHQDRITESTYVDANGSSGRGSIASSTVSVRAMMEMKL